MAKSNRDALRRLSSKVPPSPEIEKILDGLRHEPDLAVAITGAALAEAGLERLLISRFRVRKPNLIGQLFKNRGPLMDFHSKVLIANAFGVISTPMAEEFHSIKAIRNTFAHARIPLTFENEIITRELDSLGIRTAIKRESEMNGRDYALTNRNWFLLTVRLLLIIMENVQISPKTFDEALEDVLSRQPESTDGGACGDRDDTFHLR